MKQININFNKINKCENIKSQYNTNDIIFLCIIEKAISNICLDKEDYADFVKFKDQFTSLHTKIQENKAIYVENICINNITIFGNENKATQYYGSAPLVNLPDCKNEVNRQTLDYLDSKFNNADKPDNSENNGYIEIEYNPDE